MAWAFAKKEDECGIDGDGTSTYGGMVGIRTKMIDGNHNGSRVEFTAAADNWSELDAGDLVDMMSVLPKYAEANAKWYCSPRCKAAVFDRLAMAAGGNTVTDFGRGPVAAYAGYPIVTGVAMPSDDAAAALDATIMLLFGDLRQSTTFGERRGITIRVSADRYLEYDQIAIQATERFDIVNHDIGGTSARGPIVGGLGNSA
jgi:HK97 family phage major capsid protein